MMIDDYRIFIIGKFMVISNRKINFIVDMISDACHHGKLKGLIIEKTHLIIKSLMIRQLI